MIGGRSIVYFPVVWFSFPSSRALPLSTESLYTHICKRVCEFNYTPCLLILKFYIDSVYSDKVENHFRQIALKFTFSVLISITTHNFGCRLCTQTFCILSLSLTGDQTGHDSFLNFIPLRHCIKLFRAFGCA